MDEKEKEALMSSQDLTSAAEVQSARAKELAQQPDDSDAIFKVIIFCLGCHFIVKRQHALSNTCCHLAK